MYSYSNVCLPHHDLLNYRTDLWKTGIFRKFMIRYWWQSHLFLLISSQKLFLTKKLTLTFDIAASTGSLKKYMMLASLGFLWWQHMIIRGLHDHWTTEEAIGSWKTIPIPSIQFCPSDRTIPFKLCRRQFPTQIAFAMTTSKAQGQTLKRVRIYEPSPVSPHGQLYVAFPRTSSFHNVAIGITVKHRQRIENYRSITQNGVHPEVL